MVRSLFAFVVRMPIFFDRAQIVTVCIVFFFFFLQVLRVDFALHHNQRNVDYASWQGVESGMLPVQLGGRLVFPYIPISRTQTRETLNEPLKLISY